MRPPPLRRLALAGMLLALALVVPFAPAAQVPAAASGDQASPESTQYVPADCHIPTQVNGEPQAQCYAMLLATPQRQVAPNAAAPPSTALGPADIQDAYHLPDSGEGQTVAIVDAFGYTKAEQDLAVFREHYGLPPCTTANGCFTKVDQRGGTDYPQDDAGWALETALDLDAVSSACPKCHILLVQGDSASTADLGPAVDTAVALGAKFVSNSYGIDGGFSAAPFFDHFYNHPGVAVVVSSGDSGNVVSWPSTNPNVVAVGGTTLTRDSSARGWNETVWGTSSGGNGAGSGCAPHEPKPDYQLALNTNCDKRATADISADANPGTGLAVYNTFGHSGWSQVGGTSLAAPLVTAMYALAGTPEPGTYPVTYPYHDPDPAAHLTDVTEGANNDCGNVLCQAGIGWDGPTGLGSPNGVDALRSGPHGDITGTVTDAATGQPVVGVTITSSPGAYGTTTDAAGHYQVSGALVGSYQLTAHKYGYTDTTISDVQVAEDQTTTADIALTALPSAVLSGTVTDGSGHGWPLYAKITVDGYPGGPVYTDPTTGHYQVTLVRADHYTVHATPVVHGYQTATVDVPFASGDVTKDIPVVINPQACIAPGYDWNGVTQEFTGWTGSTPKDGWHLSGSRTGWSFDNTGDRPPVPGGNDEMVIADSGIAGRHTQMDTTLTTPTIDLTGHDAPQLWFDTAYYALGNRQTGRVDLSVDGGRHWQTVWQADDRNVIGSESHRFERQLSTVRARFHFTGQYAWYWGIDNVFVGTHTCVPVDGGLVTGTVTNADSGDGVPGATITGAGGSTRSAATPDDAGQPDGLYTLFVRQTGEHEFTASAPGYDDATATVTVASGGVVRHDWSLTPTGG